MPLTTLSVTVNADDLGLSEHVNAEIFRLIDAGRVTSATLIASAPAIEQAARRTHKFPNTSFGAHLNLTEFEPLTDPRGLAPLVGTDGCFCGNVRNITIDVALRRAIRAEWNAQIGRLRMLGVDVSHIDSHHHVHTIPSLFTTLKNVQRDAGIRKVRISKNARSATLRIVWPPIRNATGIDRRLPTMRSATTVRTITRSSGARRGFPRRNSTQRGPDSLR